MRAKHLAGLFLCAAVGCNALLNNEKRSLASSTETPDAAIDGAPVSTPPPPPPDATPAGPEAGTSSQPPTVDAGPSITEEAGAGATPSSCSSPDGTAECKPGMVDMQQRQCGPCLLGTETRMRICGESCGWGSFSLWSGCEMPPDACEPDEVQQRTENCGPCMSGTLVSKRSCTASCAWTDWTAGTCEMAPEHCTPGQTQEVEGLRCGMRCGISKRTQTCTESCTWGPPVTGPCVEQGMCIPDSVQPADPVGCNPSYCNKGVQAQVRRCTDSCTWSDPIPQGQCTFPAEVCRPADQGGMGYRCIQGESGARQTCYPSTASAALRCTWGPREQFAGCQR
ncbi:MAG TPA: hypothetical protein VJR89_20935 [Polyangiales bacterium]|nr:hypothetical protein [Polyangiales bacterium]